MLKQKRLLNYKLGLTRVGVGNERDVALYLYTVFHNGQNFAVLFNRSFCANVKSSG